MYCSAFSLIETTVALLLICIGVLGIAALQLTSLRQTEMAYYQSVAALQAASLLERLRVNVTSSARGREIQEWNQQNETLLPKGYGYYQCAISQCIVTIVWQRGGQQTFQFKQSL